MTMMSPFFTPDKENFPSKSVTVPLLVPLIITEAPITVSPRSSTTTPVQVEVCCVALTAKLLVPANAGEAPMHPKDTAMTNCFKSEFMFIN